MVNQGAQLKDMVKVDMVPQDSALGRKYQTELDELVYRMTAPETGVGVGPTLGMMTRKTAELNILLNNVVTVEAMLPTWIDNFRCNFSKYIIDWENDPSVVHRIKNSAIVVGAGDSVMKWEYGINNPLFGYMGEIIATNKALPVLLEHDVCPRYAVAIHSTEDILGHFEDELVVQALEGGDLTIILSSMVHPKVSEQIVETVKTMDQVVWFNPSIPDDYAQNIDAILTRLSHLPLYDTGGNAGLFALKMAHRMGAKVVGLWGMEHCHALNPKWTNDQARSFEIIYAPQDNLHFGVSPVFKGYLESLMAFIDYLRGETEVINLVKNGLLYTDRGRLNVRYECLEGFVVEHD